MRSDTKTGGCTTAFASGTTANVSLGFQCSNPQSCIAGQTLTVTNNGATTAIAANSAAGVTSYTAVPMKFSTANAEAPFSLTYSDVGQITLYAKYNIPLASGRRFAEHAWSALRSSWSKPAGFVLSNIHCTLYAAGGCNTGLGSPGAESCGDDVHGGVVRTGRRRVFSDRDGAECGGRGDAQLRSRAFTGGCHIDADARLACRRQLTGRRQMRPHSALSVVAWPRAPVLRGPKSGSSR